MQSRHLGVGTHSHMMASVAARHRSGLSAIPRGPAPRIWTGHLPFTNRAGFKRARDSFERAWVV